MLSSFLALPAINNLPCLQDTRHQMLSCVPVSMPYSRFPASFVQVSAMQIKGVCQLSRKFCQPFKFPCQSLKS